MSRRAQAREMNLNNQRIPPAVAQEVLNGISRLELQMKRLDNLELSAKNFSERIRQLELRVNEQDIRLNSMGINSYRQVIDPTPKPTEGLVELMDLKKSLLEGSK